MKYTRITACSFILAVIMGCQSDHTQNTDQADIATNPQHVDQNDRDAIVNETSDSMEPSEELDASVVSAEMQTIFTHKMIKKTDDNSFSSIAYECPTCTFEQWDTIVPPQGWSKGPAQIALFSTQDSIMRSYPSVEGHPDSVDFLDDVPGNEYRVIAVTLDGRIVEAGPNGIMAEAQVQRDTRLVFNAGMRVHELTDPQGNVFVLFVHHIDTDRWQNPDFQSENVLDYLTAPDGWVYSTRILDEELALDSENSDGVVSVLAIRGEVNSAWEKR